MFETTHYRRKTSTVKDLKRPEIDQKFLKR